ncbi:MULTISPECIES: TIGR01459 family HAD-type hydrolase [unclassified Mesorhizobium]|uniref:TIGR01459 family HAD-type hydrolase n=1 Tax=unclassified Mesorhizobium TaxID=325217 RepID=UPI000BB0ABD7|nr:MULTISPECIES: TIGR01459 family HAD-type hydrolase [unclassified Mesorhizobium]TGT53223.1 TIGR01459 family HAD-type hydrolase [Mesorhizobium sp. M00.F.Ca.ET.170.01.1.1]AZO08500.1 TIGR01459 family HAD-type hydrolase [Mesorhizobium sp. M3A.F.Ca.ET.080.04.2.1]PBB83381.1 TIGR01459 family HAD-type hydrolase [Mesorhizobium sp. WSM3876]RWB67733.1 MAG: TIGR01459 family HAD-type hydrolase [Mesorhizobium sp.]RWB82332.1 MAG: TIGR01459 family HAD-type hydrolase [Mesorhizobium sp.]
MPDSPDIIASLDGLTGGYAAILCDVWGVVHNGEWHFPASAEALANARAANVPVVLITNSPRRSADVIAQMDAIGVPATAYDRVVTSGDVTRDLIAEGPRKIFHIGPDRDFNLYDGLDVELVEEFEASGIVCTGPFDDEVDKPEDYAELLLRLRARNLPFICANPDILVERGERIIWCAGAIARDYAQLGGRTLIAGKPFAPIYNLAMKEVAGLLGRSVERSSVLAIGDGMMTDVKGAADNGFDVLYVSGGIHARDYGDALRPDPARLAGFLEKHGYRPVAVIPRLQ